MRNNEFRDLSDKKLQRLDQRALRIIDRLFEEDIPRGRQQELLQSIRDQHAEKGFLTEAQRALIRGLEHDYDDFPYNYELCKRLAQAMEDGRTPNTAESFLRSTIDQFSEKHWLSDLQREQMIRIETALETKDIDESVDPEV